MIAHLMGVEGGNRSKTVIVTNSDHVRSLWKASSGTEPVSSYGSSTRASRFKPAFLEEEEESRKRQKKRKHAITNNRVSVESNVPEESLQLNLMEALYLKENNVIHGLSGVQGQDNIETDSDIMQYEFNERYATTKIGFEQRYQAYKKFRDSKWVPKNGSQYSCDYVLYKTSPDKCHSRYCVTLTKTTEPIQLLNVFRTMRVAEQTRKRVVLCDEQANCIQLRRWVLKHEHKQDQSK